MTPLGAEEAVVEASAAMARNEFAECMRKWNGFFSVVVWQHSRVAFAVDRTRSIPLFYAQDKDRLFIGDSADWVRQRLGNPPIDPVRKAEFLLAGLVLNDATLCQAVHQVQAGEAIAARCSPGTGIWRLDPIRYRMFKPSGSGTESYEDLLKEYDRVLTNSFERALKVVKQRPILVPLSGGYDSRLLLLVLVRLGAKNVTAYSYGPKEEIERSQEVAHALGVPWRLCDYSHSAWCQTAQTRDFWDYITKASNLSAIACLQEWLAVKQLKLNDHFGSDIVVMPGYAADVPAGSFLTLLGERGRASLTSRSALERLLFRNRLSEWSITQFPKETRDGIRADVQRSIGSLGEVDNWVCAYDTWTHTERLAKFIVNALRAVDFNGGDWWLPFFDDEFLAFWERVPLEFRLGERLHCDFTDALYASLTKVAPPPRKQAAKYCSLENEVRWPRIRQAATETLRALYQSSLAKPLREQWRRNRVCAQLRRDPMGWFAVIPEPECVALLMRGASGINAVLSAKYLELIAECTT